MGEEQKHEPDSDSDSDPEPNPSLAPRVGVGPDGTIIIDKTSLHIASQPAHSQIIDDDRAQLVQEDTQEEANVTSASFRTRHTANNNWTPQQTQQFYHALRKCGADFSMMVDLNLFENPTRSRKQLRNKYVKEQRERPQLVEGF